MRYPLTDDELGNLALGTSDGQWPALMPSLIGRDADREHSSASGLRSLQVRGLVDEDLSPVPELVVLVSAVLTAARHLHLVEFDETTKPRPEAPWHATHIGVQTLLETVTPDGVHHFLPLAHEGLVSLVTEFINDTERDATGFAGFLWREGEYTRLVALGSGGCFTGFYAPDGSVERREPLSAEDARGRVLALLPRTTEATRLLDDLEGRVISPVTWPRSVAHVLAVEDTPEEGIPTAELVSALREGPLELATLSDEQFEALWFDARAVDDPVSIDRLAVALRSLVAAGHIEQEDEELRLGPSLDLIRRIVSSASGSILLHDHETDTGSEYVPSGAKIVLVEQSVSPGVKDYLLQTSSAALGELVRRLIPGGPSKDTDAVTLPTGEDETIARLDALLQERRRVATLTFIEEEVRRVAILHEPDGSASILSVNDGLLTVESIDRIRLRRLLKQALTSTLP